MPRKRRKKKASSFSAPQPATTEASPSKYGPRDIDWHYHRSLLDRTTAAPRIEKQGSFSKSLTGCHSRLSAERLRIIAETPLFAAAITQIANNVTRLKYRISTDLDTEEANSLIWGLEQALLRPNRDRNTRLASFLQAVVQNLLIFNIAPVERQPGIDPQGQAFWFWDVCPTRISLNPYWTPQEEGLVPKFFCRLKSGSMGGKSEYQPIMAENMFLIQNRASSGFGLPKSPVEIAYNLVRQWLGLSDYQERVVSRGIKDYLIAIESENQDEIDLFKKYWSSSVEGSGTTPIVTGKIDVHKVGAKGDDEMFLKFQNHLTGLIALVFSLKSDDFNVEKTTGQNRATAEVDDARTFYNAILPMANSIYTALDREVINYYYPHHYLQLGDNEPGAKERSKEEARENFKSGAISLNEMRDRLGLPPLTQGNIFLLGSELVVFDDSGIPSKLENAL